MFNEKQLKGKSKQTLVEIIMALQETTPIPTGCPRDSKERAAWVVYQLALRGKTLAGMAREQGVTRQQPSIALRRTYPKWERLIAEALECEPIDIWPERYEGVS